MNMQNALDLLEDECRRHRDCKSGEDTFRAILNLARRIEASDRQALVQALDVWLKHGAGGRSIYAMEIAGELKLTQLRGELERHRQEILKEKGGPLPGDTRWVDKAIKNMSR